MRALLSVILASALLVCSPFRESAKNHARGKTEGP